MITTFDTFMRTAFPQLPTFSSTGSLEGPPAPAEGPPVPEGFRYTAQPSSPQPAGQRTSHRYAYVLFQTPVGEQEVLVPLERTGQMPASARIVGEPITDPGRLNRAQQAGYLWEQLPPDQQAQFQPVQPSLSTPLPAAPVPYGPFSPVREGPPIPAPPVIMSTDGGGHIPMALDPGVFANPAGLPFAVLRHMVDNPDPKMAEAEAQVHGQVDDALDRLLGLFR